MLIELQQQFIIPNWNAPENVHAAVIPGVFSEADGHPGHFNLALHSGDDQAKALKNRACLKQILGSNLEFQWLRQVHGTRVLSLDGALIDPEPKADAIYCKQTQVVCGVLTADCLPVFFCDKYGKEIAIAHAGWRGLCAGILENTLEKFTCDMADVSAWLGPAIGPCHFEVGEDVRSAFLESATGISQRQEFAKAFQLKSSPGSNHRKWMANLYSLATSKLNKMGLGQISGGEFCTYCQETKFFSYRRGKDTGRFASLLYLS